VAPEETPEQIRQALDTLTPERAEEVAAAIAEQWQRDWGLVLERVIVKTGLSRSDAYQFMLLREVAMLHTSLERGIQPKFHPDCKGCQNEKRFHEMQWEARELTVRHLSNELGEDWKGE